MSEVNAPSGGFDWGSAEVVRTPTEIPFRSMRKPEEPFRGRMLHREEEEPFRGRMINRREESEMDIDPNFMEDVPKPERVEATRPYEALRMDLDAPKIDFDWSSMNVVVENDVQLGEQVMPELNVEEETPEQTYDLDVEAEDGMVDPDSDLAQRYAEVQELWNSDKRDEETIKRIQELTGATVDGILGEETRGKVSELAQEYENSREVEGLEQNFDTALRAVENSVRKGFEDGLWKPHTSVEGGNDTLAYGHKLTDEEVESGTVTINGEEVSFEDGLTEEQALALYEQDKEEHEAKARRSFEGYDALPRKYQLVLLNIIYNVGSGSWEDWPSLRKAMEAGDDSGVYEEMRTSFRDEDGNRVPLTSRRDKIAEALGIERARGNEQAIET